MQMHHIIANVIRITFCKHAINICCPLSYRKLKLRLILMSFHFKFVYVIPTEQWILNTNKIAFIHETSLFHSLIDVCETHIMCMWYDMNVWNASLLLWKPQFHQLESIQSQFCKWFVINPFSQPYQTVHKYWAVIRRMMNEKGNEKMSAKRANQKKKKMKQVEMCWCRCVSYVMSTVCLCAMFMKRYS